MSLPRRVRENATNAQLGKLRETRDCPCAKCDGHLVRVDLWEHERAITEKYVHRGGNEDCPGNDADQGFWKPEGNLVTHFLGRTEGTGVLRGEF